ncbi:inositol monophosphatase family protein [Halobacterium sp. R2-5]|uniref:inositol monophosphatase family protein n=1 Tax=Halobacterium sp. R2-5 TaxID=2715751 RepID=UPI00142213EF|nr:inositol monophosphatase family protein [Halobacterium sp. R2-5]NIB99268.1 inositol monophosphatase [Halobacterium sp. R2-5]
MIDLHEALETAAEAARLAGDFQRSAFTEDHDTDYKGPGDPVSEVDLESERRILKHLTDAYPSHGILSEEDGGVGNQDVRWVVDPLDGTSNYLRGLPDFCVSIALEVEGTLRAGVVYRPMSDDMYAATLSGDSTTASVALEPAETTDPESALVSLPYSSSRAGRDDVWAVHRAFGSTVEGIRSTGSGALDLAHVAAGHTDAACGFNQSLWDRAAGEVLVEAAGGTLTDHTGGENHDGDFLASNGHLHGTLVDCIPDRSVD